MSVIPQLGTLKEVGLRLAWEHEAHSFTPWLAQHLDVLANEVGIRMELEGAEVNVGSFWADILARNLEDDSLVLIENQLEMSNHDHLGKIMTYLAGLEAKVIIWVAGNFRDEHLSAIRWLNDHTMDPFAFFAIKVKVMQIGDSPLAPVFEILERPNEWERRLQNVAKETQALTPEGQFQRAFWSHYVERFPDERKYGKPGSPSRWRTLLNGYVISSSLGKGKVSVFIRGGQGVPPEVIRQKLALHEAVINEATGVPIGSSRDRFFERVFTADTTDEARWNELTDWLYATAKQYERALSALEN